MQLMVPGVYTNERLRNSLTLPPERLPGLRVPIYPEITAVTDGARSAPITVAWGLHRRLQF